MHRESQYNLFPSCWRYFYRGQINTFSTRQINKGIIHWSIRQQRYQPFFLEFSDNLFFAYAFMCDFRVLGSFENSDWFIVVSYICIYWKFILIWIYIHVHLKHFLFYLPVVYLLYILFERAIYYIYFRNI
jgi:hypothetical protein